jgi:two-component system sensor histidine kinase/response regulator
MPPVARCATRARYRRKQAEDELRKLSLAVEQSPESIIITNVDAQIEYVNEAFVRASGYARAEVLGATRACCSRADAARTYVEMWAALIAGGAWKGELHNRRRDGVEYVEFAIVTPIRQADGRITHYVAVKEDITEKKRIGAELDRYRHHLEDLVRRRGRAVGRGARARRSGQPGEERLSGQHEPRDPYADERHRRPDAPPAARRPDAAAGRAPEQDRCRARHLLAIINDMLDLSKIEIGKLALEQTDFPPRPRSWTASAR